MFYTFPQFRSGPARRSHTPFVQAEGLLDDSRWSAYGGPQADSPTATICEPFRLEAGAAGKTNRHRHQTPLDSYNNEEVAAAGRAARRGAADAPTANPVFVNGCTPFCPPLERGDGRGWRHAFVRRALERFYCRCSVGACPQRQTSQTLVRRPQGPRSSPTRPSFVAHKALVRRPQGATLQLV